MSSVSFGGGCSSAMWSATQSSRAAETSKTEQLFSKLDVNGDSELDVSELGSFVDAIAEKTGTSAIDAGSLLTSLDSDGNGSVSSTELGDNMQSLFDQLREQLMGAQMQSRPQPPDPAEMFGEIDSDGDGSISQTELDSFLAERSGATGGGPDAAEILARDDADGDGSISADEFTASMQRGPGGTPPADDPMALMLESLLKQYASASATEAASSSTLEVAA